MIIEKNGYIIRQNKTKEFVGEEGDEFTTYIIEFPSVCDAKLFDTKSEAKEFIEEWLDNKENYEIIKTEISYWLDINENEEDIYKLIVPNIQFAKMKEDAIIPSKTQGNVGYDIYACFPENQLKIEAHETKLVPTGIASIIPDGYAMILKDRGSTGSKGLSTACGVIDSNFRGEWFVAIHNENDFPVYIIKDNVEAPEGKCICYPYKKAITQAILIEDISATVEEIDKSVLEANVTDRGTGALGSSGK